MFKRQTTFLVVSTLFLLSVNHAKAGVAKDSGKDVPVIPSDITSSTAATSIQPVANDTTTETPPTTTIPTTTFDPPAPPNTTTTVAPTTTTTPKPTTTTTASTTPLPTSPPTTTTAPTTPIPPTTTSAPAPEPHKCGVWSGLSFIGGIVFTLGLGMIGGISWKFYKSRTDRNYHTL